MKKLIGQLKLLQCSIVYSYAVALLVLLSSQFGWELPTIGILCALVIFTLLTGNDTMTLLPPLFMGVMCFAKRDVVNWYKVGLLPMLPYFGVLAVLVVASVVFYCIKYRPVFKPDLLFWGLVAISLVLVMGGVFYDGYNILSLPMGALFAVCFVGIYMLVKAGNKHPLMDYLAKTIIVMSILVLVQLTIVYIDINILSSTTMKSVVYLGWCVSNNAANVLLLGMPFCLYYVTKSRNGWLYILLSWLLMIGILFTMCRGCLLLGVAVYYIGAPISIMYYKKRRLVNWSLYITSAVLAIVVLLLATQLQSGFIQHYVERGMDDSSRLEIYRRGLEYIFGTEPVLGVGFMDRHLEQVPSLTYFYHNTYLQFLVNCGLVGLACYIFHRVTTIIAMFRKPTKDRLYLFVALLTIIGYSFIDCSFFFYYFAFYYTAILVAMQKDYERVSTIVAEQPIIIKRKPRVLFPYVEAGLGHIIPMRAVANAFDNKYGDKVEVVRSRFYAEGTPAMRKFEQRMVQEVRRYSTSPLYGVSTFDCMHFLGQETSMKFVMRHLIENAYSDSVEAMKSLDVDMVFSTHWATSYVAKDVPSVIHNIQYCPDADMDMQWLTGCDLQLISCQEGRDKAIDKLNYPQDKIEVVPCVIRPEAEQMTEGKQFYKQKLGLPTDKFTIVLVDGGYACGKLRSTVEALLLTDMPITVVPVCGKNEQLYQEIKNYSHPDNITYAPIGYCENMLEVVACADLFMGKSGANTVAEFCYFGVPQIITLYATPLERAIGEHYVNTVGSAVKAKSVNNALEYVSNWFYNRSEYDKYVENAVAYRHNFGAEEIADLLYNRLMKSVKDE